MSDATHDLLAELGWLRALARKLVRDPDLADDLVQDACTAALTQPTPPRCWRAWFATVLPNLWRGHHRRRTARQRREAAVAGPAATTPGDELVQRAEAQHRLAAAVLQLDEPYRSTVLLRFFDGLPPRRIATALQLPIATVRSRLQRGLAELRHRLDRDFGDRSRWLAAFTPFTAATLAPTALPLLVMQTKVKLFAAVAALACSVPLWWPHDRASDDLLPTPDASSSAGSHSSAGGGGGRGGTPSAGPRREAVPAATTDHATSATTHTGTGRVVDCRGLAVAGVPVGIAGQDTVLATSDTSGRFAFAIGTAAAELQARSDHHITVLEASWSSTAHIEPVLVVAPAVRIGGRVVDEAGVPIADAELTLQLPADFDTRFPMPLDRAGRGRFRLRTAADGSFPATRLPHIEGASLLATADVFAPATVSLPPGDDLALQIVLRRFAFATGELRGRVVDAGGSPAAGARVAMGVTSVTSDADGTFVLSLKRAGWPTAIVAAKAGHLPGRCELPRTGGTEPSHWPQPLVLQLGTAPQTVRGRVVDAQRRGIAGAEVWIADPTPLGVAGLLPLQLEYLLAGGAVPRQAARMPVPHADDPTSDGEFHTQAGNVREPNAGWYYTTTDADGGFELGGLLDRPYTLRALDVATGTFGELGAVLGSSHVELVIARDRVWPELRGRVVSLRGAGVAGVRVTQHLVAARQAARVPGGRFEGTALRTGATATTAADGSFVLRNVARERCHFALESDAVLPARVEVDRIGDPLQCVFEVEARCHVELVLADPREADEARSFDRDGRQVQLAVLRRNSNAFLTGLPLHDGRSGLFVVGERAARLELLRGGQLVRTIPFTPDPQAPLTLH